MRGRARVCSGVCAGERVREAAHRTGEGDRAVLARACEPCECQPLGHGTAYAHMCNTRTRTHTRAHTRAHTQVLTDSFDWSLQPYLTLRLPAYTHAQYAAREPRRITSGGADAVARLMVAAAVCADARMDEFAGFVAADSYSFGPMWYVLENVHITAKVREVRRWAVRSWGRVRV